MASRLSKGARSTVLASYATIFENCTICFFTGIQPSSPDDAETGQKLVQITLNSGDFTPGSPANGLNFGAVEDQILHKKAGEVWSGVGLADGVAGWARIYDNSMVTGANTNGTAVRWDLSVGQSGANINMSNTNIVTGGTTTIDSVNIPMPASL